MNVLDPIQQEYARIGRAAMMGTVLGAVAGLYWFGVGGALLFAIVGSFSLGWMLSNAGLEFLRSLVFGLLMIAAWVGLVMLIDALWGVGRIAD